MILSKKVLLSNFKKNDVSFEQKQTKAQKTLEFETKTSRQSVSFETPLHIDHDGNWMLGLTNLDFHIYTFNITEKLNKFLFEKKNCRQNQKVDEKIKKYIRYIKIRK